MTSFITTDHWPHPACYVRHNYRVIFFLLIICYNCIGVNGQPNSNTADLIKALQIPGVTITAVQEIDNGSFTISGGETIASLPAMVRVAFTSKPSSASNIRSEVWLPKEKWNGRFLGTGNGGGAGKINYGPLVAGIRRGFATANTDMGTSPGLLAAVGQPEIWADFGYRCAHEMTTASKIIIQAYYKKPIAFSYFSGCSTGGQQALMEAQRYPEDYNGIIAGAPANNRTHLHAFFIWNEQALATASGKKLISQKKMALLASLVIKNCAGKDGGAPGDDFLTDPSLCKFNPEILPRCEDGSISDSCFSATEIDALKKIYAGPVNPASGQLVYPPLPLGGPKLEETIVHFYPFKWAFGADFDFLKFDFNNDMQKTDSILAHLLNATDPDLSKLKKRGGKLLMYTGTADQLVPYPDAINYYESVIKAQHGIKQTQSFFRYFLVPGMGHCGGGPASNDFGQGLGFKTTQDKTHDILTALMNWVEKGIAPSEMIATSFKCCDAAITNEIRFQRPLYPYPAFPNYTAGDPNLSSSYKPVEHPRPLSKP